jgi:hypothetical protein
MSVGSSVANTAPFDGASNGQALAPTDDDFGVILFAGGVSGTETTHRADELPAHWQGREVGLVCSGGVCYVAFSKRAGAEVDRAVAATNAGATAKSGLPLPNSMGVETRLRLPKVGGEKLYFVRESDTVGTKVWMRLLG